MDADGTALVLPGSRCAAQPIRVASGLSFTTVPAVWSGCNLR
jgi:hypothetical protein